MKALLVDAGNTRIKWAVGDLSVADDPVPRWHVRGACPTRDPAELAGALAVGLGAGVERALYCSVAGDAVSAAIESTLVGAGIPAVHRFRSAARVGPLANAYARPGQLGADRLAAALGAWQRVRGEALVVGAGTATTIDLLRRCGEGGEFAGGVILPGIELMIATLARRTADLPQASGRFRALPDNTDDAIVSGALQAQLGAIDRMRALLPAGAPCVLGGGAADRLLAHLSGPLVHAPDLVLEGLAAAILHGFQE